MDYSKLKERLIKEFGRNNFFHLYQNNNICEKEFVCEYLKNGTFIIIRYPGYKSNPRQNIYDYRVYIDFSGERVTLSHANIIVDIYYKCFQDEKYIKGLPIFIKNAIIDVNNDPFKDINLGDRTSRRNSPGEQLTNSVIKAIGGKHIAASNRRDLTLEKLAAVIKWITLQEDINYPPPRQGRLMPYSRYLEAVHVVDFNHHEIAEVLRRAVFITTPPQEWDDLDYSLLKKNFLL